MIAACMRLVNPILLLVCTLGLCGPRPACAAAMRCSGKIIQRGTPAVVVRAMCGRPASVQNGYRGRSSTVRVGGPGSGHAHTVGTVVPVETWIYNRGPGKLLVRIRLVNGVVTSIHSFGVRGY